MKSEQSTSASITSHTHRPPSGCFCWCFPFLRLFFPFNKWQSHTASKKSYCHCKAHIAKFVWWMLWWVFFDLGEIFLFNFYLAISLLLNSFPNELTKWQSLFWDLLQLLPSTKQLWQGSWEHRAKQKDLTTEESFKIVFKETVLLYAVCEELSSWATVTSTLKCFPQGRHLLNDITTY